MKTLIFPQGYLASFIPFSILSSSSSYKLLSSDHALPLSCFHTLFKYAVFMLTQVWYRSYCVHISLILKLPCSHHFDKEATMLTSAGIRHIVFALVRISCIILASVWYQSDHACINLVSKPPCIYDKLSIAIVLSVPHHICSAHAYIHLV